ncbi:hypothetical protein E8E12_010612 [Didymella heteroderae]|uniref:Uncharacterized protein n=1 Tax=Didymella heteroderae TaxID=1769908 RepID=A0A9P4X092_9PLEO|nr:hypothetical protein E8E12_010612 [Didymella heteroderae]
MALSTDVASPTIPNDTDHSELPVIPDRPHAYVFDSVPDLASYETYECDSSSNVKQPTVAEIERLVDAHGSVAFLDEHGVWPNLGYDLDFGRELTKSEAAFIRAAKVAHVSGPTSALHPGYNYQKRSRNTGES